MVRKALKRKQPEEESHSEEEVVKTPAKKRRVTRKSTPKKSTKKKDDSEEEDEFIPEDKSSDEEDLGDVAEEEELESPKPKKSSKKKATTPAKKTKRATPKKKKKDDSEDEEAKSDKEEKPKTPAKKIDRKPTVALDVNWFSAKNKDPLPEVAQRSEEHRSKFIEALKNITASRQKQLDEEKKAREEASTISKKVKYTPMEQQIVELKKKYPDVVLFVEVGYRYKFFGADAEIASKVLGIIAYRQKNLLNASIPTFRLGVHLRRIVSAGYKAGIVKQTETSAEKAVGAKSSKGPFTRDIDTIYTKGTMIISDTQEQALMDKNSSNSTSCGHLLCVYEKKSAGGVEISMVAVEVSTGEIMFDCFEDDFMRRELDTRLLKLSVVEVILPTNKLSFETERVIEINASQKEELRIERIDEKEFNPERCKENVEDFYSGTEDDEEKPAEEGSGLSEEKRMKFSILSRLLKMKPTVLSCFSVILNYLKRFKLDNMMRLDVHFHHIGNSAKMSLNSTTLRNLEILCNSLDGTSNFSLFALLNHCYTPFGTRLLKQWLCHPLLGVEAINDRLNAVEEIASARSLFLKKFPTALKGMPDFEKSLMRIHYNKCSPKELLKVLKSFEQVFKELPKDEELKNVKSKLIKDLFASIPDLSEVVEQYLGSFSQEAAEKNDYKELFMSQCSSTVFPEIFDYMNNANKYKKEMDEYLEEARKVSGKKTLEFKSINGKDFVIELTHNQSQNVPEEWNKVGETKTVVRYQIQEVMDLSKHLVFYQEKLTKASDAAWQTLLQKISSHYSSFRQVVDKIATLDCLYAFAEVANMQGYVKPVVIEEELVKQSTSPTSTAPPSGTTEVKSGSRYLMIKDGRHPVIEKIIDDPYVPNSVEMKSSGQRHVILTGPNMGGKSSFIKQTTVIVIMAQIGCFVPAKACKLTPFDGIYTRMGARDNISEGESTFMVELSEASDMLSKATNKSLVVLDELGRGTTTYDGSAIAYSTLKYLIENTNCFTLFVTHFPIVTKLEKAYLNKSVLNYYMDFMEIAGSAPRKKEEEGDQEEVNGEGDEVMKEAGEEENTHTTVTFLYKLRRGAAGRSYGINVASLAGLPKSIINRAVEKASEFEEAATEKAEEICFARIEEIVTSFKALPEAEQKDSEKLAAIRTRIREITEML